MKKSSIEFEEFRIAKKYSNAHIIQYFWEWNKFEYLYPVIFALIYKFRSPRYFSLKNFIVILRAQKTDTKRTKSIMINDYHLNSNFPINLLLKIPKNKLK